MISLFCETSTLLGSVAIHQNGQLLSYSELFRQNSHSDTLNKLIKDCLKKANLRFNQIDVFGSGLGPGSFTGIRISINTIKTLAYVYKRDCYGIDSLTGLALRNKEHISENQSFVCGINAFKNMIYFAQFKFINKQLIVLTPPKVVRVQSLGEEIQTPVLFIGDAFSAYQNYLESKYSDLIIRNDKLNDYPSAQNSPFSGDILDLKPVHWSQLLPLYIRASEAEENLNGIKYQPL